MWFINVFIIGFILGGAFVLIVTPELKFMLDEFMWKYKSMSNKEKEAFHKEDEDTDNESNL